MYDIWFERKLYFDVCIKRNGENKAVTLKALNIRQTDKEDKFIVVDFNSLEDKLSELRKKYNERGFGVLVNIVTEESDERTT